MLARTASGSALTSWPATVALPPVRVSRVQRMEMVVVLPAPLGPRNPKSSPGSTVKEMSFTAVKGPKRLTRCSTSTAGLAGGIHA